MGCDHRCWFLLFQFVCVCVCVGGWELDSAMGKEGNEWVVTRTGRAPSNIAVIKYWGKRDEKLILPINSSISVTLDPAHLSATTTVSASPAFESDRLWLNGKVLLPSPTSVSSLLKIMTSLDSFPKASSLDCCFSLLLFRFPYLFLFWFWSFFSSSVCILLSSSSSSS